MPRIAFYLPLLTLGTLAHANDYAPIQTFLDQHCVACHGAEKQKAEVRLDDYQAIDGTLWTDIYDQIHHGDMPPEDEPQPSAEHRAIMEELVLAISRDDAHTIATGFRRLNRREYANTVQDLLGLREGIYDPAAQIFEDEIEHGFDTNAAALTISNELLLEYLDSAERSLRLALFLDKIEKPETKRTSYNPAKLNGGNRRFTATTKETKILRDGEPSFAASSRAPAAGLYHVTVTAKGVGRNVYPVDFPPGKSPVRLAIGGRLHGLDSVSGQVAKTVDLQDEKDQTFSATVWLEKGAYPFVKFANASGKPATILRAALRRRKITPQMAKGGYRGPGAEITRFEIEGPLDPEWPPASYKATFRLDEMPDFANRSVRELLLLRFLSRSFRRPATDTEIADYLAYFEAQHKKTGDWHEATIKTYAAVMASHAFLYIKEEVGPLDAYALASRLSYGLWSTMPDKELFKAAHSGELLDPKLYKAQVERLLRDAQVNEFVDSFATQWLSLDALGTMRPANKGAFAAYHKNNYEAALRQETLLFFRYILFQNQPIGDFLDSDYTFLNKALADAYNIPFDGSSEFQMVALPADSPRGGLLGHGSMHALTSNGVETLPVTRGHWVLDELMGSPPPPPPEEVPALVPDLNGLDTPREQLVRHREDPSCFECHKQMDPLGLALESFDVIGRYRTSYGKKGANIDPRGELDGQPFSDLPGLRRALRKSEPQFARALTIKLAEYFKGRSLNRNDLDIVDTVVASVKNEGYPFNSLLREILLSDLMTQR